MINSNSSARKNPPVPEETGPVYTRHYEPTQSAHGDQAGEQGAPGNNDADIGGNGHQSDETPS
ncbi:hypothetical protein [Deinococcus cellulosilyticus]|uniref:Uncharacterized protein n=1 Tax=Deinococcus cellulosilyticus (strain DSM 18568 / NBRC 106333 / KACC 11606 / 5516J-15) TaxID=1223518 RepID=A0A511MYT9_DEIC1|nr:hypothetical protein [Deinococcus cellulosilyticus]GEM45511.1 hypothetical protein DC3_11460 [Deinococcus cellulosilyticus NBRC 106333 = KACC 11606]